MECRLCLRFSPAETVVSIHGDRGSLANCIWSCCQLQVQKEDNLPASICSSCEFNLHFFVKFKDVCIRSDEILRSRLAGGLNIKTEEVVLEDLNWEEEFVNNSLSCSRYPFAADKENEVNSKKDVVKNEIFFDSTLWEEVPMVEISSRSGASNIENPPSNEESDFTYFGTKKQPLQIDNSLQENLDEFECDHCGKLFCDKSELRSHISTHFKQKPCKAESKVKIKCKSCKKNFAHSSSLKRHLSGRCQVKSLQCGICFKTFKSRSYLKAHEAIHTGKTNYKCNICSKYFVTQGNYQRHAKLHSNVKPHKCNVCPKSFAREYSLKTHKKVHTRVKNKQVFKQSKLHQDRIHKCNVCFKSFFTKTTLASHMNVHSSGKLYKCEVCPAIFNRKGNLDGHMIVHTKNKPYKCDVCFKTFSRKSNLVLHVKLHTGDKPFSCRICFKTFARATYLTSHMDCMHEERRHPCDMCTLSFPSESKLFKHVQSHDTDKSYKPFPSESEKKPYTCHIESSQHSRYLTRLKAPISDVLD
ncbi:uncharacterized protein LOC143913261 [Arctopsyche grandis]|uniref:uncharacterized protein LOC143913261 n=1 Tax=Arctopsyche grandis TaxID=121162 RepID=UPI00406D6624